MNPEHAKPSLTPEHQELVNFIVEDFGLNDYLDSVVTMRGETMTLSEGLNKCAPFIENAPEEDVEAIIHGLLDQIRQTP